MYVIDDNCAHIANQKPHTRLNFTEANAARDITNRIATITVKMIVIINNSAGEELLYIVKIVIFILNFMRLCSFKQNVKFNISEVIY